MVKLTHVFNQIEERKILVAGDFMVDRYTFGKSKRISPEAPVPVILVDSEEERAGGAGNVVLNLVSLGMQVTALGRVGDDAAGQVVKSCLTKEGVEASAIFCQKGFQTPQKARVIASNQQIVRIDYENITPLELSLEAEIVKAIDAIVQFQDIVAISDYAKGFLTDAVLQAIITAARKYNIPVIADPKGIEFTKYNRATVLKPNLSEAYAASNLPGRPLTEVAAAIFAKVDVDVLMVTRSEAGISLYYPDGSFEDHPVQVRQIRDVTGAGDTVLAVLCCALANGLSLSEATALSNIAATVAVERVGCARVTLSEIARRMIELHAPSKIFENAHSSALVQALKGKEFIQLQLPSDCKVDADLLRCLRKLASDKVKESKELVVTISDPGLDEELVSVLASLKDVDYIHISPDESELCIFRGNSATRPSQIFEFENANLVQKS